MGLPLPLFALSLVLGLFGMGLLIKSLSILLGLFLGVLLTMAIFRPLQHIHRHDPKAMQVWLRAIRTPSASAYPMARKSVRVQTRQHTVLPFHQWRPPS